MSLQFKPFKENWQGGSLSILQILLVRWRIQCFHKINACEVYSSMKRFKVARNFVVSASFNSKSAHYVAYFSSIIEHVEK